MPANSDEIVEQMTQEIRAEMEALMVFAQSPSPREAPTAYEMEGGLLRRLLSLGQRLLTLYFICQAARHRPETVTVSPGRVLPYFGEKRRSFVSIFGRVSFHRSYYWAGSGPGHFPLDAALNLPLGSASDRLREWREALGVDQAYHRVGTILGEFLGLATSSRTVQTEMSEDARAVEAFYAQAPPPDPVPEATLLVVQADGKGVPMVSTPARGREQAERSVRRGKGEKAGRKKEAVVTAVYTQSPRVRTPEEVVQSLFGAASPVKETPVRSKLVKETPVRSRPVNRRFFATLDGKARALSLAAGEAARQEAPHLAHRIALTDGSEALQERTREAFPDYTLVLDFIHADEYLWKAANALLGETAAGRTVWVKERALQLLSGQTLAVMEEFRRLASDAERTTFQRETLLKVAAYYERNRSFMHYDRYLALGWPIATGVIEGACRHLVKDRCERSGMRWTQEGAEALLQLRCVAENGDWERFQAFRREKRHREIYGMAPPTPVLVPGGSSHSDIQQPLCFAAV